MIKLKYFFAFMFLCGCCKYPDPEIGLKRENYNGDELRLDGYYYLPTKNFNIKLFEVFFLFRNGIILNGGTTQSIEELDDYALSLSKPKANSVLQNDASGWGTFQINNEEIIIEILNQGKNVQLKSYIFKGLILDSATFLITNEFSNYTGKNRIVNDTFYFRPLSVKPDSTNRFIK